MTPRFRVWDAVADRESGERGRVVHLFKNDSSIVAVQFIGARDALAMPIESLRRVRKTQKHRRRR